MQTLKEFLVNGSGAYYHQKKNQTQISRSGVHMFELQKKSHGPYTLHVKSVHEARGTETCRKIPKGKCGKYLSRHQHTKTSTWL